MTWIFVVLAIAGLLAAALAAFCLRNMYYDAGVGAKLKRAGFAEKQAALPNGTVLNYGEGPAAGPPLLLLHGQMVQWQDYHRVLPTLAKRFHVYAVDCHGHGGSSKDPARYTAAAMGEDFTWFLQNVVGAPALVSGHSSGALLAAWLAANAPQWVRGALIEDGPFFATQPGRCEKTFAGLGFAVIHNFLNQSEESDYQRYNLQHSYMQTFFGDAWAKVEQAGLRYLDKHPGKPLRLFWLPPSLNKSFALAAGPYDLRFGDTFHTGSWFAGFDQAETLARVGCPALLVHTSWQYDDAGILLAAMDGDDAARAHSLMQDCELASVKSGHGFHDEKPREFLRLLEKLAARVDAAHAAAPVISPQSP